MIKINLLEKIINTFVADMKIIT